MTIERIGVVGAGQMGNGIAHVLALAGYDVLMTDTSADALNASHGIIGANIDRQVARDKVSEGEKAEALARIKTTGKLTDLGPTDLIIEAATEREAVKVAIFEDLVPHLKPDTILTSNTSSISITRLASPHRPARTFHGLPLHEPRADHAVGRIDPRHRDRRSHLQRLPSVVERLGKTAASAEDFPAFIVNRILMPMINEAVYTLYEGVGSVQSIDSL